MQGRTGQELPELQSDLQQDTGVNVSTKLESVTLAVIRHQLFHFRLLMSQGIWEIPQDTIHCPIRSMVQHRWACVQACGGQTNWVPVWITVMKYQQNGLVRCFIWSSGCLWIQLSVGWYFSFPNYVASFHSSTLPSPYQYRCPVLIFPPTLKSNKFAFIFLSSVF